MRAFIGCFQRFQTVPNHASVCVIETGISVPGSCAVTFAPCKNSCHLNFLFFFWIGKNWIYGLKAGYNWLAHHDFFLKLTEFRRMSPCFKWNHFLTWSYNSITVTVTLILWYTLNFQLMWFFSHNRSGTVQWHSWRWPCWYKWGLAVEGVLWFKEHRRRRMCSLFVWVRPKIIIIDLVYRQLHWMQNLFITIKFLHLDKNRNEKPFRQK